MVSLTIKDYYDLHKDYAKAGDAIYVAAVPLITKGETILFDMKGLDAVSTVFLNMSFGQLMDRFGVDKVKGSFRFSNVLKSQAERIRKYFRDYAELQESHSEA